MSPARPIPASAFSEGARRPLGRTVAALWEGEEENRSGMPGTIKKPRKTGAPRVKTCIAALVQGVNRLLLFLRGGFLFRCFLGCALHRLILPNIKFCDYKNRNVIHI